MPGCGRWTKIASFSPQRSRAAWRRSNAPEKALNRQGAIVNQGSAISRAAGARHAPSDGHRADFCEPFRLDGVDRAGRPGHGPGRRRDRVRLRCADPGRPRFRQALGQGDVGLTAHAWWATAPAVAQAAIPHAGRSAAFTFSGVNGTERSRTPTASNTAFEIADGTTDAEGSPAPHGRSAGRSIRSMTISGTSGNLRIG